MAWKQCWAAMVSRLKSQASGKVSEAGAERHSLI